MKKSKTKLVLLALLSGFIFAFMEFKPELSLQTLFDFLVGIFIFSITAYLGSKAFGEGEKA